MQHSKEFLAIVDEARSRVRELTVSETLERLDRDGVLVDVREDNE